MTPNRDWIFQRKDERGNFTDAFKCGVDGFMKLVFDNPHVIADGQILCPCKRCRNNRWLDIDEAERHIYVNGFLSTYTIWKLHGETILKGESSSLETSDEQKISENRYRDMVNEAAGIGIHRAEDNIIEEEFPNESADKFYKLLRAADEPLWDGCESATVLSAVTQLLNLKSEFHMTERNFTRLCIIIKGFLPPSEKLPDSYYKAKTLVSNLGMGYEKIDCCRNHCMLFHGDDSEKTVCPTCGLERYKILGKSRVAHKQLRYFPITPRLQRLFMSEKTSRHMSWHKYGKRVDECVMTHPSDAQAWKAFDDIHPTFSAEVRNVRLGLCTDGFTPFGSSSTPYSCWPVFVTPYNLPPSMCMKREHIYLALLIPGPKSPVNSIDVYLRPLIEELKSLWNVGVTTFDASKRQNFNMRASLLWTVSDFPGYGMLSGWSTHGKLACPYCMGNGKAFTLKHGKKPC